MNHAWKTIDDLPRFGLKALALVGAISLVALTVLPLNVLRFESSLFYWETSGWLGLTVCSSVAFYYSAFPERAPAWPSYLVVSLTSVLLGLAFTHQQLDMGLGQEITQELSLWRGRCGILIGILALAHAAFLFRWAHQAAPRSLVLCGLWASLSAAALGCLLMQPVCLHENLAHLLVWHFAPLLLLCFGGTQAARYILKW